MGPGPQDSGSGTPPQSIKVGPLDLTQSVKVTPRIFKKYNFLSAEDDSLALIFFILRKKLKTKIKLKWIASWRSLKSIKLNSTGPSNRSFYLIFNKRFYHLEILLTIRRPKNVLSAGLLCGPLVVPSPQSKCSRRSFIYSKSTMLQVQICHQSHLNVS